MSRHPHLYEQPSCRDVNDPDLWIEETNDNRPMAVRICRQCPHVIECAQYGLEHEVIGIWGGLSTKQRAELASRQGIIRQPLLNMPIVYNRKQREKDTNDD